MAEEKVLVVGLGEVGLPLYKLLRECGKFLVYGFDINEARMSSIEQKVFQTEWILCTFAFHALTKMSLRMSWWIMQNGLNLSF